VDEVLAVAPALIYPGADAAPVSQLLGCPPRPLLFIDATWRKSRRLLHEYPELARLQRYALHDMPPSRYRIRKSTQVDAVSSLEAIVHTLELLEQAPGRYTTLLKAMDWMIAQQINYIGTERLNHNYQ
jgi:DTW domain-containing protein